MRKNREKRTRKFVLVNPCLIPKEAILVIPGELLFFILFPCCDALQFL